MPDISMPCSCCGLLLTLPEDKPVVSCPACGTHCARPRSEGPALDMLSRAVRLRLACDFAGAERSYQQVLLDHPDSHEALWGRLLCHYGVEYVEDPRTKQRMPTVHSIRRKPLQAQQDFRDACLFAPPDVREQYERDAEYIDQTQAAIRQLAESCPPFDVFICHKSTRLGSSEKTEDFHRAYQLHTYLEKQGVRAFFAPESLSGMAGADYEAGIFHALETAKLMLVLCSDPEYLASPWVRSEWSRYLQMADEDDGRLVVPLLYDRFDAHRLPAEFRYRRLQGLAMGELTSTQTLTDIVRRHLGDRLPQSQQAAAEPAPQPADDPVPPPAPAPAPVPPPVQPAPAQQPAPAPAVQPAPQPAFVPRIDPWQDAPERYPVGRIVSGRVSGIEEPFALITLQPGVVGRMHASQCTAQGVQQVSDALQVGQLIRAKVMVFDPAEKRILLSIRQALQTESAPTQPPPLPVPQPVSQPEPLPAQPPVQPAPQPAADPAAPTYTAQELFTVALHGHGCMIVRYIGKAPAVRIPPVLSNLPVLAIGPRAFRKLAHLQSVSIPEGVTEIGDHAFEGCKLLQTVELPGSLRTLGKYAFAQNPSLTDIRLPEGLQTIHQAAFWACKNLCKINIPACVDIRTDAFLLCQKLSGHTLRKIDSHTSLSAKLGFRR